MNTEAPEILTVTEANVTENQEGAGATDHSSRTVAGNSIDKQDNGSRDVQRRRHLKWSSIAGFYLLPGLVFTLALGAAYGRWTASSADESATAQIESVAAAREGAVALLSYKADTVEQELGAAGARLTGPFGDTYRSLIHDVVIPGAKQKHISAVATVPAAASVSATPKHAVVLVFVNQTTTVDNDPPADTASSIRVTLDKSSGHWLITAFDPI